jgi:predicted transcriptional regulator of viral defense system
MSIEPAATYKRKLWRLAVDQYGFVTTGQAREIGVPVVELAKLAHRGVLSNVAYGLYRMNDVPTTERDAFMAAVLRVGDAAYLMGESTLALYELASVNPRSVWVGTPRRTRAKHPSWLHVVKRSLPVEDLTVFEAIPTVTVKRAFLDCRGRVMTERLLEAADRAVAEGLVLSRDRDGLFAALQRSEDA